MSDIVVLVVDDDFRVAELHSRYVSRLAGFSVTDSVRSGAEVLRRLTAAQGEPIDLLLLDSYLPDGSGIDIIGSQAMQRSGADVIMVTADNSGRSARRALQLGALNYLLKPFEPEQLTRLLSAYREYRRTLGNDECDQSRIDRALRALYGGNRQNMVRGRSPLTAARITELLSDVTGDLSALEVAERAGISRATAQRYLAQLAEEGMIEVFLRYGSTGRPEHRYQIGSQL